MANHVRFIRRRSNGVFYYERRLPKAVQDRPAEWKALFEGKALFRRSLGTRRQSEALAASQPIHDDVERRLAEALGDDLKRVEASDNTTRRVTPALLTKITENARARTVSPWQRRIIRAELGADQQAELERLADERECDAEDLRAILSGRAEIDDPRLPNIADDALKLIEQERLDAPVGSTMHAIIKRAVREGQLQGQREIDAILSGNSSALPLERRSARGTRAPKISEAVEAYVGQLRAPRSIREAKEAGSSFVSVVGDLPLDEISRTDVVEFCKAEGARTIGGKTSGSISRPMSSATLKKKVGLLRASINHAIQTETYSGENPAAKIDVRHFTKPVSKALMPNKRPFTVHELQLLVAHPWFTGCESPTRIHDPGTLRLNGMHFWVPILAMHTGCRAGELGGLRVSEVRLDHEHPHIVIQDNFYRTTKGSYRRSVPLLDILLDLGFGQFVKRVAERGHDRLFFDWEAPAGRVEAGATAWSNASLIRSFNRTVVPQQLGSILMPGARQEVTFHSFRGAFKTLLGRSEYNLPDNYKHEVIGHAKSALDKRYVQEIPLADTYPAMRMCRYEGLSLPTAP